MMGFLRLFKKNKPKIKITSSKNDGFSGWVKCSECSEMMHSKEMQENLNCCPKCQHHYPFSAQQKIDLLADKGSFVEMFTELKSTDPLSFIDTEHYVDRIAKAQQKTGREEGFYAGLCTIKGREVALGVMDFAFMGGSMGSVVGEKITRLIEYATDHALGVVLVCASGGARMQESCLSLMQMAKTSAALARLDEKKLPYISVLTNPTTGGVTASFAALGDVIIAEPDALIGFAGRRVVEQTIRQKLPERAQKSEFLLEKGMIDCICHRADLKEKISFFLEFLMEKQKKEPLVIKEEKLSFPDKLHRLMTVAKDKKNKNKVELEQIVSAK